MYTKPSLSLDIAIKDLHQQGMSILPQGEEKDQVKLKRLIYFIDNITKGNNGLILRSYRGYDDETECMHFSILFANTSISFSAKEDWILNIDISTVANTTSEHWDYPDVYSEYVGKCVRFIHDVYLGKYYNHDPDKTGVNINKLLFKRLVHTTVDPFSHLENHLLVFRKAAEMLKYFKKRKDHLVHHQQYRDFVDLREYRLEGDADKYVKIMQSFDDEYVPYIHFEIRIDDDYLKFNTTVSEDSYSNNPMLAYRHQGEDVRVISPSSYRVGRVLFSVVREVMYVLLTNIR